MNETPERPEERLLLLAPTGNDSADARAILTRAGFSVTECRDLLYLCNELSVGAAALLIAEESLSLEALPAFVECVKAQPPWSDLPVILLTGRGHLTRDTNRLFELFGDHGNITLLERPFRINTLLSLLRTALRSRRRQNQVRDLLGQVQRVNNELERRVAERTAQLNSSVKSLESFCHSLAHDLRAPVRAIRSFAKIIQDDYNARLEDDGRRMLQRVGAAAERMDLLINDLLTLSRVSQADVPLVIVDVARVTTQAVEDLREEIQTTRAEIKLEPLEGKVRANPIILRQVIENFLSNALKYTRKNETPRIHVWSEKQNDRVRISVQDHGIGIPAQFHDRIFELFQRLHSTEYSGTGVGLAIAKAGAERMLGRVGVTSDNGSGSCFWVDLEAA
jgi:signal transduction histidine kinase